MKSQLAFNAAGCESADDLFLQNHVYEGDGQGNNDRHRGKPIPWDAAGVLPGHVIEGHGEGVVFGLG
jgi:hypothetical protein